MKFDNEGKYFKIAEEFKKSPSWWLFKDSGGTSITAIAEYLANKDGYTIYKSPLEKEQGKINFVI